MAANREFIAVDVRGWRLGFSNMLRKENRVWLGTRRLWLNLLIWTVIINGTLMFALFMLPDIAAAEGQIFSIEEHLQVALQAFYSMTALGAPIAAIILAQGGLIEERQSGTAEMILSKPVSRTAFFLSKWLTLAFWVVLLVVVVQGLIGCVLIYAAGLPLVLTAFLKAEAIVLAQTLFYLSLTLCMGVFTQSRGTVLGVSLGTLLLGEVFKSLGGILVVSTPWMLASMMPLVAQGSALPEKMWIGFGTTWVWVLFWTVLGLWKFNRIEL